MTGMTTIPSRLEYTTAMQNPAKHFRDPELVHGSTVRNKSGQPTVYSGQFASVYRLTCNGMDRAVRCFAVDDPDRQQRYAAVTAHLGANLPDCFASFTYLDQEMLVGGTRHPVVKMDWVQGETVESFVNKNRNDHSAIS